MSDERFPVVECRSVPEGNVVAVDAEWQRAVFEFLTRERRGRVDGGPSFAVSGVNLYSFRFGFEPVESMRAVWE